MAEISLPAHLIQQLEALAESENRTPAEILESMLRQRSTGQEIDSSGDSPPAGTLARLALKAEKLGFRSGISDTAERSREILENEFGDYLNGRT